jgi:acyl carrier protein
MPLATQDVERAVTAFIVENFLFGNAADAPKPDASFMETGLIDSTGILELVTFIEGKYEISVGDDQLVPENLDSVANIAAFVARTRGA